jgi:hypothetical protein
MSKVFGVEDFAKRADIEAASARVMLRKLKAKKAGKNYEFKSTKEMDDLIAKARKDKAPAKKKAAPKKAVKKKAKKKVVKESVSSE